ncbi:putative ACT domain-containing protein ACR1-12 [Helianthus anomalus]
MVKTVMNINSVLIRTVDWKMRSCSCLSLPPSHHLVLLILLLLLEKWRQRTRAYRNIIETLIKIPPLDQVEFLMFCPALITVLYGSSPTNTLIIPSWLQDLGSGTRFNNSTVSVGLPHSAHLSSVIELIGSDRPGLLSEVCRALFDLRCNIVNANVWTHNTRAAFLIVSTDEESGTAITDPTRLSNIKTRLCNVLTVTSNDDTRANIVVTQRVIHPERRLHQMKLADRDYERGNCVDLDISRRPDVNIGLDYCLISFVHL